MRFKLTLLVGFAAGYVLGSRAGRERYEQIRNAAGSVMGSEPVRHAGQTAKDSGLAAAQRAADGMADKLPPKVTERVPYLRDRAPHNGAHVDH